MTFRDVVSAVLAALFLLGAGLRLSSAGEPQRVIWPEIPALPEGLAVLPTDPASADRGVETALARNVFSASRSAPSSRFSPGAEAEPEAAQYEPPPPPPPPRYRVAGTMLHGSGGMALIDADPSSPGPEVYRQGDAVGGYRLEQVAYDHVVLVGAAGEVRLNVARPGEGGTRSFGAIRNRVPLPDSIAVERATTAEGVPPGAIPRGW